MPLKNTKAISKNTFFEEGCKSYSQYYNLSDTSLLYYTRDENSKKTILKVYAISDLETVQAQRTLNNEYRLMCILEDSSILLRKNNYNGSKLIKLCPLTLNILITQPWKKEYIQYASQINDECFFLLLKAKSSVPRSNQISGQVVFYQQKDNIFIESHTLPLTLETRTSCASISSIFKLNNNRYGCHLRGHNTSEFSIVIFDVDFGNKTITAIGTIRPKSQHSGSGSPASGEIEILANGQLLTYHQSHDNVQIWDPTTLQCIKEWNWSDVIPDDEDFNTWCVKIKPIMHTGNLLVYQNKKLFLFNIHTLSLKKIELSSEIYYFGAIHALPNDGILIFTDPYKDDHLNHVLHFDTKELEKYRKNMGDYNFSKSTARRFFNTKLPPEMTELIIFHAFNSETRALASELASREAFENDEISSCSLQ